jgi:hypothetical protein
MRHPLVRTLHQLADFLGRKETRRKRVRRGGSGLMSLSSWVEELLASGTTRTVIPGLRKAGLPE